MEKVKASPCGLTEKLSNKFANMALVCSFFVVFIHTTTQYATGDFTWWTISLFRDGICRMAVPFFFLASGFFLAGHCHEKDWWSKACNKRIHTLLVPFLVWSVVWFVYSLPLVVSANIYSNAELTRNLPHTIFDWLNVFGVSFRRSPYYGPLWFVRWLIVLVLLSCFFVRVHQASCKASLLTLFFAFALLVYFEPGCGLCFSGLFFFNLGLHLRLHAPKIRISRPFAGLTFLLGIGIVWFVLHEGAHGISWVKHLKAFAILFMLGSLWIFMPTNEWKGGLARNSFPIFLVHGFITTPLAMIASNLPIRIFPVGLSVYLVSGVIAIVGSIVITLLLRKFFPKTAAVFFGGR